MAFTGSLWQTRSTGMVHRTMNCRHINGEIVDPIAVQDVTEAALVSEYGNKACSTCFPSAPSRPAQRPSAPSRRRLPFPLTTHALVPSDKRKTRTPQWDQEDEELHPRAQDGEFTKGPDQNAGTTEQATPRPPAQPPFPDSTPDPQAGLNQQQALPAQPGAPAAPGQPQEPAQPSFADHIPDPTTTGTGSKDDPVVTGSVDDAAVALAMGLHVELHQPQQVSTLLDKLSEQIAAAKAAGTKLDIDLCNVTVQGTNLFCVDEATEILTEDGWVTYDRLSVGDRVLTLNHETGFSEWQENQAVNVFPAEPRLVLSMEGRYHSSLTSLNHRWPTVNKRSGKRQWRTSETLGWDDSIQTSAPCATLPAEVKYLDALVEIVAWAWTEGTLDGAMLRIYQSATKNPHHCASIRASLTSLYGPAREGIRGGGPGWREALNESTGMVTFFLNKDAADPVLDHIGPEKAVLPSFIRSLTEAQLRLFIDRSLDADGHRGAATTLGQRSEARIRSFEMACALAGIRTNTNISPERRPGRKEGLSMHTATLMKPGVVLPVSASAQQGSFIVSAVMHEGILWCPTTPNTTWLARREGKVFFTGNCAESKGIPRVQMPQLKVAGDKFAPDSRAVRELTPNAKGEYDLQPLFLQHLKDQGYTAEEVQEAAVNLKATQNQLNGGKIAGMTDALLAGKSLGDEPIFVSEDDYIVDGHHRWAANAAADYADGKGGDYTMSIWRIDVDIITLLDLSNKFAAEYGSPQASVTASRTSGCSDCGPSIEEMNAYARAKTAMADRSGIPEVDSLIEDFLKRPMGDWTNDDRPNSVLMDPVASEGACVSVTDDFVEFAKSRGFKAYTTHTDLDELGYRKRPKGSYFEHAVASIYIDGQSWPIEVDFTASQYGYKDHPKVTSSKTALPVGLNDIGSQTVSWRASRTARPGGFEAMIWDLPELDRNSHTNLNLYVSPTADDAEGIEQEIGLWTRMGASGPEWLLEAHLLQPNEGPAALYLRPGSGYSASETFRGSLGAAQDRCEVMGWDLCRSFFKTATTATVESPLKGVMGDPEIIKTIPPEHQDAFRKMLELHQRQQQWGSGGKWYHASKANLPAGTVLVPGGGPQTDPKFYEDQRAQDEFMGAGNRADHVWVTPDREDASFWAAMLDADFIYEVEPTNPRPWGISGTDGYVCSKARIVKRLSTTGSLQVPQRHPVAASKLAGRVGQKGDMLLWETPDGWRMGVVIQAPGGEIKSVKEFGTTKSIKAETMTKTMLVRGADFSDASAAEIAAAYRGPLASLDAWKAWLMPYTAIHRNDQTREEREKWMPKWQRDYSQRMRAKYPPNGFPTRENGGVTGAKTASGQKLYHITDQRDFKLDPKRTPDLNTTMGGTMPPGIFLSPSPEHWLNGYGYWRPWIVEFSVPAGVGERGGYGREVFIPAEDYDKVTITRVLPLDGFCREEYGEWGWMESDLMEDSFTGETIPDEKEWGYPQTKPRVLTSPDARTMDASWAREYAAKVRKWRRTKTNAIASKRAFTEPSPWITDAIEVAEDMGWRWPAWDGDCFTAPDLLVEALDDAAIDSEVIEFSVYQGGIPIIHRAVKVAGDGDWIIDITASQFNDDLPPVLAAPEGEYVQILGSVWGISKVVKAGSKTAGYTEKQIARGMEIQFPSDHDDPEAVEKARRFIAGDVKALDIIKMLHNPVGIWWGMLERHWGIEDIQGYAQPNGQEESVVKTLAEYEEDVRSAVGTSYTPHFYGGEMAVVLVADTPEGWDPDANEENLDYAAANPLMGNSFIPEGTRIRITEVHYNVGNGWRVLKGFGSIGMQASLHEAGPTYYHGTWHDLPDGTILLPSSSGEVEGNWNLSPASQHYAEYVWLTDSAAQALSWGKSSRDEYVINHPGEEASDTIHVYEVKPMTPVVDWAERARGSWARGTYACFKARITAEVDTTIAPIAVTQEPPAAEGWVLTSAQAPAATLTTRASQQGKSHQPGRNASVVD